VCSYCSILYLYSIADLELFWPSQSPRTSTRRTLPEATSTHRSNARPNALCRTAKTRGTRRAERKRSEALALVRAPARARVPARTLTLPRGPRRREGPRAARARKSLGLVLLRSRRGVLRPGRRSLARVPPALGLLLRLPRPVRTATGREKEKEGREAVRRRRLLGLARTRATPVYCFPKLTILQPVNGKLCFFVKCCLSVVIPWVH
jgi:hypothetical protein